MRTKAISRFHYITQDVKEYSHAELARMACEGGADWVQLRVKGKGSKEWRTIALEVQEVCKEFSAIFIVNDNVSLAKEIKADGVHLGKEDMSPVQAREILGSDFIIGGSTNTELDILMRNNEPLDYIGLGPLRFTSTRENLNPVLGAEGIIRSARLTVLPVIAIGGIILTDLPLLLKNGVHGVAVSSAVNLARDPVDSAKQFIEQTFSETHSI